MTDQLNRELFELIDEALIATDQEPIGHIPEGEELFLPDAIESVTLATLITLIEERFDIEFDDEDLDPEAFETISSIADLVRERLKG